MIATDTRPATHSTQEQRFLVAKVGLRRRIGRPEII